MGTITQGILLPSLSSRGWGALGEPSARTPRAARTDTEKDTQSDGDISIGFIQIYLGAVSSVMMVRLLNRSVSARTPGEVRANYTLHC